MTDFYNCIFIKQGLAFGVGAFIFLLTLLLAARRVIGFTLTVAFLLIALGAAMGIKHQDLFKDYWNKGKPKTSEKEAKPAMESKTEPAPAKAEAATPEPAQPEATQPSPVVNQPPSTATQSTPAATQSPPKKQKNSINLEGQSGAQKERIQEFMDQQSR